MSDERQGTSRPTGDAPDELEEYKRRQFREYNQWVAAQDIYAGQALAYRKGDPVPVSNVELHSYDKMGLVEPSQGAEADAAKKATAAKKEEGK